MDFGINYFVQPSELVGTNRYKVGCSAKPDLSRLITGPYRKGTRFIIIIECIHPFKIEQIIKSRFREKFKLISGTEYFEGNEEEMKKEYYEIITNNSILKPEIEKIVDNTDILFINYLNTELEIDSSYELEQKIPREKIENIRPYLMENWQKIHDTFSLIDRSITLIKHDTFESHIKLLQKIYLKWCGCTITPLEKDRNKKTLLYILKKI